MKALHLIQHDRQLLPRPIVPGSNIYENGFWALPLETAQLFLGKDIYFHEKQLSPSFFGGVIKNCRLQVDGQWKGRVIFTFESSPSHKEIRPKNPEDWNWVMNVDND